MLRPRPSQTVTAPSRGFSLLELVIVVCIVAVLATLATERLTGMRVQAERVQMESLLGNLRSAMGIKVAGEIAKGRQARVAQLTGSNPMDQIAETPDNYRGAFYGIDPALFEGGQWYFDKRDRTLVYRVQFAAYFETGLAGPARARFTLSPVYEDLNNNGTFEPETDRLTGMRLHPVEAYRWLDRPR